MRTIIASLIFLLTLSVSAQVGDRVLINGKVTAPVGEDPQGISVINSSAMRATVSNESGLFQIRAAEGDTLSFKSLQFQDFSVLIDPGVIENRQLNVFISEAVTELPEVVVTPYDLSGNVEVDVRIIPTEETDLPTKSAAEVNPYEHEFRPDSLVSPHNAAHREGMIYSGKGQNLANVFRHIFTPRDVVNDLEWKKDLDEQVLMLHDDEFFEDQLNIEEDRIKEFIYYAGDNGLTKEMLKPENEMDLIQFLIAQSIEFREMKADK
jgi:hypothetical protein